MYDTAALHRAYQDVIAAAEETAGAEPVAVPPGEWDAEQVLAHVGLVTAGTLAAVAAVAAGSPATFDNRISQDGWTIGRVIDRTGGGPQLRGRVAAQGEALGALAASLGAEELDTALPTLLLSHGRPVFEGPLTLRDLLDGLAATELPGHAAQLRAAVAS
ncbi:DinB family protein [Kitasatospora griseola]|uniref:DinB family protein n=1 Tax=Kitasatospora griseola TaxID=2064 RepID=UPI0037F3F9A0